MCSWSTDYKLYGVIQDVVFTHQPHFSCSYLPLICLSTNQNIQLIHSLLIRIEWITGNEILVSSSHWPIYNKFPPGYTVTMMPCCRCWLGQGLGAPGAAGGGGGQAARAQVRAVNQEKALVRTFFVIVNSADGSIAALVVTMTLSAAARAAAGASCVSTPAPPRSTCRRWWASRRCWPAPSPTSTTTRWGTSHQSPVTIYIYWSPHHSPSFKNWDKYISSTICLQCIESGMQPPDNHRDTALGAGFVLAVEWGHLQ